VISRRVHLTEAGKELARTARAIAGEWELFGQKIDAMKGLTRGRLRVAVVSTAKYFVPRLLGSFCAAHPEIDISLEVLNRDGVVQRLRENLDDLYIMSMPNPLLMIASLSHPLAHRKKITVQQLSTERFILRERGSGTRMAVDAQFRKLRFSPLLRLELGSNEAIKQAVAGGLGISVVSRHALYERLEDDDVAVLDAEGFPIASQWHVVYPKGKQLSPIARVFNAHLLEQSQRWSDRAGRVTKSKSKGKATASPRSTSRQR
jgi:DNA-binding transcriptional LysR family regulator